MEFKNMGTYDGGVISSSPATAMASQRFRTMDAAAIANNGAFLQSELEKKDNVIRQPLTSFTYSRDLPIRVGGGWAEFVSAMNVDYGVTGGSEDGPVHAGSPWYRRTLTKGCLRLISFRLVCGLCGWICSARN